MIADCIDSGAVKSPAIFAKGELKTFLDVDALICVQIQLSSSSNNVGKVLPGTIVFVGTSVKDETPLVVTTLFELRIDLLRIP